MGGKIFEFHRGLTSLNANSQRGQTSGNEAHESLETNQKSKVKGQKSKVKIENGELHTYEVEPRRLLPQRGSTSGNE